MENAAERYYVKPLKKLFGNDIMIKKEKNIIEYIVFDGEKEEFFLSFYDKTDRIDLFWEKEQFIFDRKRELLGYDESCGNFVYENMQDISDDEKMANVILSIINVLNNGVFKDKQVSEMGEYTNFMRVEKLNYVLYIEKRGEEHREYTFGNIRIIVNNNFGTGQ